MRGFHRGVDISISGGGGGLVRGLHSRIDIGISGLVCIDIRDSGRTVRGLAVVVVVVVPAGWFMGGCVVVSVDRLGSWFFRRVVVVLMMFVDRLGSWHITVGRLMVAVPSVVVVARLGGGSIFVSGHSVLVVVLVMFVARLVDRLGSGFLRFLVDVVLLVLFVTWLNSWCIGCIDG